MNEKYLRRVSSCSVCKVNVGQTIEQGRTCGIERTWKDFVDLKARTQLRHSFDFLDALVG